MGHRRDAELVDGFSFQLLAEAHLTQVGFESLTHQVDEQLEKVLHHWQQVLGLVVVRRVVGGHLEVVAKRVK